jgi:hypothetical protein
VFHLLKTTRFQQFSNHQQHEVTNNKINNKKSNNFGQTQEEANRIMQSNAIYQQLLNIINRSATFPITPKAFALG